MAGDALRSRVILPRLGPLPRIPETKFRARGWHGIGIRSPWPCHHDTGQACKIFSLATAISALFAANPAGLPKEVFDGFQATLAANRAQFYLDLPNGPFYGYNRPGAKPSQGIIQNWWRQGMMGGIKAHYDGIVAFSQTDFTEDLKKFTVPTLVMHSEDDQIVPYVAAGPLSAKLVKGAILKTYKNFPHGMPTTEADTINADLLAFLKGANAASA